MKRINWNEGWFFYEKDGKDQGRRLDLPHDAMQDQGRAADAPTTGSGAFYLGGVFEYEKRFTALKEWEAEDLILEFEGVMPHAAVFLNEEKIPSPGNTAFIGSTACAAVLLHYCNSFCRCLFTFSANNCFYLI